MALTAPTTKTRFAQIAIRCLVSLTFCLELGCAGKIMESDIKNPAGIAEMSKDGVLTIHMFDAPKGSDSQIVKPSDPYYEEMRQIVGGIQPGERKSIVRSIGQVHMDANMTITYTLHGIEKSGPQFLKSGQSKPGDPDYDSWISRVGGLKPGETKVIPAN